jgi:hypothetical protein
MYMRRVDHTRIRAKIVDSDAPVFGFRKALARP